MSRSARFPSYSLDSAIEYAEKAYKSVGQATVDSETFFNAMGFSGRSGGSVKALATVKYYDLVNGRGDSISLTDLFLQIHNPLSDKERAEAILKASRSPDLFAEIFSEFQKLPDDNILRSIAIRRFGLSEAAADRFVSTITETNSFVEKALSELTTSESSSSPNELQAPDKSSDDVTDSRDKVRGSREDSKETGSQSEHEVEKLRFRLSNESHAEVIIYGIANRESLERLVKHLEFTAETYEYDTEN